MKKKCYIQGLNGGGNASCQFMDLEEIRITTQSEPIMAPAEGTVEIIDWFFNKIFKEEEIWFCNQLEIFVLLNRKYLKNLFQKQQIVPTQKFTLPWKQIKHQAEYIRDGT